MARCPRGMFSLPRTGLLDVAGWSGETTLFNRTLATQAGDFVCETGRLIIHSRRWFVVNVVAGREDVTAELSISGEYLVAQIRAFTAGVITIVPIVGITTNWYRFPRLCE
jgi:hypothetical protein